MYLISVIVNLLVIISKTLAKYEEGHIRTFDVVNELYLMIFKNIDVHEEIPILAKWAFIARFCFLSDEGQFEYSIQYNKTCEQRENILDRRLNQIIPLKESDYGSGCTERKLNSTNVIQCHQSRTFRSARERWWFLAISNCNSTKGLDIHYRFLMTNGPPGDYWHQHFSADEFYILPMLLGYCVVYLLLVLAVIMCSMELKSRQLYHSTYKLFAVSVYLQTLGIILQIIAYVRYAFDGIGLTRLKNLGRFCESSSEVVFLMVLLLMAKGYTITRGRLRMASTAKLTIFICVYVVMYITMFIYERLFFDPGEVLYLYESPAGYGLITLRILAWWMFIYSTVFTLKHYPEKGAFYYPFNLVGTMWFVTGPAFILTANTLIDKWVRESVVCALNHFVALAGHLLFLVLTVPNRANKNFPYHVRTTQIGIMEVGDGILGTNTLDHFGHHSYAPGGPVVRMSPPWSHVPIELFTVSSTIHTESSVVSSIRPHRMRSRENYSQNLVIRPEEISPVPRLNRTAATAPNAPPIVEEISVPELRSPSKTEDSSNENKQKSICDNNNS